MKLITNLAGKDIKADFLNPQKVFLVERSNGDFHGVVAESIIEARILAMERTGDDRVIVYQLQEVW